MSALRAPVVIVGPMRSGTTMLAQVLDAHPDVTYLGFELSEQWSEWTGLPWGAPGADDRTCPSLDGHDATPQRIAAVREGLEAQQRDGPDQTTAATVVLKNPHLWHRLPFVRAVLPGARYVRTRRELLPTVASLRRLWRRSLHQHEHRHHLPTEPDRCWDYVPEADVDAYPADRTFPGGSIEVLAEFWHRVERTLDGFGQRHGFAAEVAHHEIVRDFAGTTDRLQHALELSPHELRPPEALDPRRLEEWRDLLAPDEQQAVRGFVPSPDG